MLLSVGQNIHEIVDGLIGDEKPFGDVDDSQLAFQGNGTDQTELLDRYFHSAAKLLEFLHVNVARTDDAFEMELSFQMDSYEGIEENIALFISPFLDEEQRRPLVGSSLQFSGLRADQVSGFFILSCKGDDGFVRSCVLHCPEERFNSPDLDVGGRVRLVLGRILDSDDSALSSYVSFAFGFDTAQGGSGPVRPDPAVTGRAATSLAPGMYEQLLRSLSDDPDASKRLEHARSMETTARYRAVLGQPNQEELLGLLQRKLGNTGLVGENFERLFMVPVGAVRRLRGHEHVVVLRVGPFGQDVLRQRLGDRREQRRGERVSRLPLYDGQRRRAPVDVSRLQADDVAGAHTGREGEEGDGCVPRGHEPAAAGISQGLLVRVAEHG